MYVYIYTSQYQCTYLVWQQHTFLDGVCAAAVSIWASLSAMPRLATTCVMPAACKAMASMYLSWKTKRTVSDLATVYVSIYLYLCIDFFLTVSTDVKRSTPTQQPAIPRSSLLRQLHCRGHNRVGENTRNYPVVQQYLSTVDVYRSRYMQATTCDARRVQGDGVHISKKRHMSESAI